MKKLIKKENYSGLKGELIKLTGRDIITAPTNKYNEIVDWGYQILINNKPSMLINKNIDLRKVKNMFSQEYYKQSSIRVWSKQR